jgi:hypothetical protein
MDSASTSSSPRDEHSPPAHSPPHLAVTEAAPALAPEPLTAMLKKRASAVKDGTTAEHAAAAVHSANAVEVLPARDYLVPTPKPNVRRKHRRTRSTVEQRRVGDHDSGFAGDDEHDDDTSNASTAAATGKLTHAASVSPPPVAVAPAATSSTVERKPSRWGFWWGWGTLPEVRHEANAANAAATAATASKPSAVTKAHAIERRRARRKQQQLQAYQKNRLRRVSDSVLDIAHVREAVVRSTAPLVAAPTPSTTKTATTGILPHSPAPHLPRLIDTPISPKKRLQKFVSERQLPGGVPALLDEASNRTDSDSDNDTVFSTETEDGHHTDVDDAPPVPRSAAMPIAGAAESLTDIPDDDNMLRHMSAPSPQTLIATSPAVPHRTHTTSPPPAADDASAKADDAPQQRSSWFFWSRAPAAKAAPAPQRSLSQSLEMPGASRRASPSHRRRRRPSTTRRFGRRPLFSMRSSSATGATTLRSL